MDFSGALKARLLAEPAVSTIVGNRVTWVDRPQGQALPAITLQVVDDERAQHMKGFQGLRRSVVQVDVWATGYRQAEAIKEAVIETLVPSGTALGVQFSRAFVRARDLGERTEAQFIYRPSMDFTFFYSAQ